MTKIDESIYLTQNITAYLEKQNIQNNLLYISPEETQRLNLQTDYRSELYLMGVMIYKLYSGVFPFDYKDDMQLIYAHTSATQKSLTERDNTIPQMISRIVDKLLQKNPFERYASVQSLIYDLVKIKKDSSTLFELAFLDKKHILHISPKIFAREKESQAILNALNENVKTTIAIAGYSGVGKSTLISIVKDRLKEKQICFLQEKFQQLRSVQTFQAFSSLLSKHIKNIIAQDSQSIKSLETQLIHEIGENIQLMLDYLPELSLIVHTSYKLKPLQAHESQSRFNITFLKFVRIVSSYRKQIVFAIDDMQWCDLSTINLIQLILDDVTITNVSFVLSYRNNEVKSTHPFSIMLSHFETNAHYLNLELQPLKVDDISLLLEDTFSSKNENIYALAAILKEKTDGNPFFVRTVLKNLYEDGFISYINASWQWDIREIQKIQISKNIVENVTKKIQKLSKEIRELFAYASLIGNIFTTKELASILEKELSTLDSTFALHSEFFIHENSNEYKFIHDKVQEAFALSLKQSQKELFHYKTGRHLADTPATNDKDIFLITNHLNSAVNLLKTPKDRYELLELNQNCAEVLIKLNSYENAISYLIEAITLQGSNRWENDYTRSVELTAQLAEVYYLNLEFKKSKESFDETLKHAKNLHDKIKITQIKIFSLIAQNKSKESLDLGLSMLEEYGVVLPEDDNFINYYPKLFDLYDKNDVGALKNLAKMTNKEMLNIIDILNSIMAPAYQTAPALYPKICYVAIDMCIKNGNSPAATNVYAVHGLLLSAFFSAFDESREFAKLSQDLVPLYDANAYIAKVNMIANACVNHWSSPLSSTLQPLKNTIIQGVEMGDFEYASYNGLYYSVHSVLCGKNIGLLKSDFEEQVTLMNGLKQNYQLLYSSVWEEFIEHLLNYKKDSTLLEGEKFSESKTLDSLVEQNTFSILYNLYYIKAHLAILYEDSTLAYKFINEAKKYHIGVASLYQYGEFFFYEAIITYRYYKLSQDLDKKEVLTLLDTAIKYYDSLCLTAPQNNLHKKQLLEALLFELNGDKHCIKLFQSAAKNAKKNDFTQILGIIYQYSFYYWLEEDVQDIADTYLIKTYEAYYSWGALGVCQSLVSNYPSVLKSQSLEKKSLEQFDLQSILKISETLSTELEVNELLKNVMNIIIENSSAQVGYLFFLQNDQLTLQTSYMDGNFTHESKESLLPMHLVKYVEKTKTDIILNTANYKELVTNHPI
ncbi:AAA family ATPase [Sulfurimonas sp. SAG-AH-194-C21]|nr:AAA family ATPase [Sulfurimonas sp. SAG-AH-194-C21]MDF1884439.1 AAA family ATPase [Sulfurimonas sp. SAG-AH-194-C21]